MSTLGTKLFILLLLIFINGFLAASEVALISLNKNKIKVRADKGDKKAQQLSHLLSDSSRFLAIIQIGITLTGFFASAFAADTFSKDFAQFLLHIGVPLPLVVLETMTLIIVTFFLSYFTLVFGELVPKKIALHQAEAISMLAIGPLRFLSKVSLPYVKLLSLSTNLIVRLFGIDPFSQETKVTEEEIRMMVDVGKEKGTVQESEKVMIENVFEFNDKTVAEIMTHRTKIVAIPIDYTFEKTLHLVNKERYTRFPVYQNNIDNIVGILHIKDLLKFIEADDNLQSFHLKKLIKRPYFVLESKSIDEFFNKMQKNRLHLAIVIDEYGGTFGLVTIEDALEEIVGDIADEYDNLEDTLFQIEKLADHIYLIDGETRLYKIENVLNIKIKAEDLDTLNGFLLDKLGYIPKEGENPCVTYENIQFIVQEMNNQKIKKVKVIIQDE